MVPALSNTTSPAVVRTTRGRLSLAALVAANLIPLVGVALWGWDVRNLLLLYWAENVVVATWTVMRMLVVGKVAGLLMGTFFCVHFGIFTFVHLVFVWSLTDTDAVGTFAPGLSQILNEVSVWGLLGLFVSHGVSFFLNFLGAGEWRKTTPHLEMAKPYPRMIVLHIAIIAGAFVTMALGQPVGVLIVLVLLKIALDSGVHLFGIRCESTWRQQNPMQNR